MGLVRAASTSLAAVLAVAACGSTPASPTPAPTGVIASTAPVIPSPTPEATPSPVSLKVMDFNIEYGGVTIDLAKIIEAIQLADPDIVALEEAEGNTRQVAEALGWPFYSARSQLVSKLPLIDPPGANGLYEYVEVRPGEVAAISNVHLPSDPYGPTEILAGQDAEAILALERETRLPMLQARLDVLPGLVAAGIPTFLTGDFNAPSHLDWTEAAVGSRPHVLFALAWPVSTAIEAAGFRDAYREIHPDPVTHPGLTWWAGRPLVDGYPDPSEPQDRIDIIYAAGPSTTIDIGLVGEQGGPQVDIAVDPWGTDHRGVLGTFALTPAAPPPYVAVDQRLVTVGDVVTVRFGSADPDAGQLAVRAVGTGGDPIATLATATGAGSWELDPASLPAGEFEVQLTGPGGTAVASALFSVVVAGTPVTLVADTATVGTGDPIKISWRDAPGSRWDWLGVYARGGDPLVDSYLYYTYTDQSVAGSVVVDENGEGDWPLPPGEYDVHYLLDDGYTSLASAPLTITE